MVAHTFNFWKSLIGSVVAGPRRDGRKNYISFFFYSGEGSIYTREKVRFSEITRLGVTRVFKF